MNNSPGEFRPAKTFISAHPRYPRTGPAVEIHLRLGRYETDSTINVLSGRCATDTHYVKRETNREQLALGSGAGEPLLDGLRLRLRMREK